MVDRAPRRLPGVRFAAAPPPVDPLPRMDVAAFVGFAARGPLHVPVAVESAAEVAAVFGDDATVAWDPARGEAVVAHLGPALRAFFRNGGRRAWVIRVAGPGGSANTFPVSGLLRADAAGRLSPAVACAVSTGSWSDALTVGAALQASAEPIVLEASRVQVRPAILSSDPPVIDLSTDAVGEVVAGDLLRVTFPEAPAVDERPVWMVPVVELALPGIAGAGETPLLPGHPRVHRVLARGRASYWFRAGVPTGTTGYGPHADVFPHGLGPRPVAVRRAPVWTSDEITVALDEPPDPAFAEGSFVRLWRGDEEVWIRVRRAHIDLGDPSGTEITGPALRRPAASPSDLAALGPPSVERLRFELWTRFGEAPPVRLADLGLGAAHPRFWGALPTDEALHRARLAALHPRGEPMDDERRAALWREASTPRFPLAGGDGAAGWDYLPVAMPFAPDVLAGTLGPPVHPAVRDGLAGVSLDEIFLDPRLADTSPVTLAADADSFCYQSPEPRPLTGIHAALAIEEATLLAAPDVAHRAWRMDARADAVEAAPAPATPPVARRDFVDERLPPVAPSLAPPSAVDAAGTFTLRWSGAAGARYRVEESPAPSFDAPVPVYELRETEVTLRGRPAGVWYYRVRAEVAAGPGPWSRPVAVRVERAPEAILVDAAEFDPAPLLRVQAAMLRLAAARGDLLALLGMPEHYREADAVAHAAALAGAVGPGATVALDFGALYHPWLVTREDTAGAPLRRAPPEGAIAGVSARRALTRGAWTAPANEPLGAVVALSPRLGREAWQALRDAQINLVRQEPGGFLVLAEDTLSADADRVPIHVRRLLALLRRAALDLGATYVFEPDDAAFRRLVQRAFEAMLGRLYARGAFSGSDAASAFEVLADPPSASAGEGRLVVELRVAPASTLTALTVRLVQSGDRSVVTEVR